MSVVNSKIINLAMVGCGEVSHAHYNASLEFSDAKFTSCCDIDIEKAKQWSQKYDGIAFYASIEELLKNEKVDAVVLCTWPNQHLEQIETILKYGVKNILCEKSMVLTGLDAFKIWKLAKDNNAFVMEACKNRYYPAIRKIESILSTGELGNIDNISATFSNYEPEGDQDEATRIWRYRQECGGGVPYDWMAYLVNAANYFSRSKPDHVFASGTVSERYGIITRLYGMIVYENGIVANIASSKDASFSQELQISCSKGVLELPVSWGIYGNVKLTKRHRMQDWPYILTDSYEIEHQDGFRLQLQNFVAVIQGNEKPMIPLEQSVQNTYTIDALVQSAISKQIIQVKVPNLN